ncbi:MAG: cation diffusion facilitator family transporter [Myxococcales bacterium]|nr:cation diffusion facilitator family transporter [Myxococcales bacterium]
MEVVSADHGTKHIIQSLLANVAIALAKGVAAVFTGSGAMLAETIHSAADCSNQALLLLGVKQARRPPDATHPLGYGRALYFWSFMVALLLFTGGGVFSIYEGIHKLGSDEAVHHVGWGIGVLLFSLAVEGWAALSNVRDLNKRRKQTPFFRYLRESKDSDLVVVFGENSAAALGLVFALAALGLSSATGDPMWDAVGSLAVGVVLVGVAIFLAVEIKSLLVGEAADPHIAATVRGLVKDSADIEEMLSLITVQQGPGEVMVAAKVRLRRDLTAERIVQVLNGYEARLREQCPDVKWSFVEPDIES